MKPEEIMKLVKEENYKAALSCSKQLRRWIRKAGKPARKLILFKRLDEKILLDQNSSSGYK